MEDLLRTRWPIRICTARSAYCEARQGCDDDVSGRFKLFSFWTGISNGEVRTGAGVVAVLAGNASTEF